MKKVTIFVIGMFLATQWSCKKEPEKFIIEGRIVDGTTDFRYKNLTFDVFGADRNENASINIGSFTTNDSGDFKFIYEKVKGSFSISLLNSFIRFKRLPVNQNINKVFYKSSMGKYRVICECPNIKSTDTLFLEYGKITGSNVSRAIDTLTNVKNLDFFTYDNWPRESVTLAWGINSNNFDSELYQGDIIITKYLGKINGNVSGDPVIDEFKIKY